MKIVKEYISDILTLIGSLSIIVGSFLFSTVLGFIVLGLVLITVGYLLSMGGD